ncbi:DNA repair and recombination protein RAD51 [Giardia duodenalis]|uniref:DNA repair and recombination protein RAD51 n=1 Tax=Giardia intestinalis TaxID=5741 RepID=V6TSR7_GIAIN|nr:DNA repair and recombination protein RAD51 [Giardia intestinalis]
MAIFHPTQADYRSLSSLPQLDDAECIRSRYAEYTAF